VQSALRLIQQNLKGCKVIPKNGFAIFASAESYV